MDETTKKALNDFVQQIISAAQAGASWTADQAPLVVQEWLNWMFWSSVVNAAFSVVIIVVMLTLYIYGWRKGYMLHQAQGNAHYGEWDWGIFTVVWSVVGGVVTTGITCFQFSLLWHYATWAIKVVVAPRVVVLEKFVELVK